MLTLEELQASTINVMVAREAHTQVDRHLIDILDVRKSFEQKAATLMGAYITISVALFGIGGAIFKDVGSNSARTWPFFAAGLVFIAGAWCFIAALKSGRYAALGSTPEMWLNRGTIDGGDNAVAAMLAYITYHHRERIAISVRGNELKARWIDVGIFLGPVAPIVFLILFLVL
jgi:hypothetical protein